MNKQEHEALRLCVASLDQLLPYLAKVPADVGLLNGALMAARPLLNEAPVEPAPAQTEQQPISRDTIRAVFLRNGFTVKEGQADLKPYVYVAAEELLRLNAAPVAQTEQQPVAWFTDWPGRRVYADEPHGFDEPGLRLSGESIRENWHPLYAAPVAQTAPQGKFAMGDRVKKTSGSEWVGHVCGTYSTALTPEGYAVESEAHAGSVQIYPDKALEAAPKE